MLLLIFIANCTVLFIDYFHKDYKKKSVFNYKLNLEKIYKTNDKKYKNCEKTIKEIVLHIIISKPHLL